MNQDKAVYDALQSLLTEIKLDYMQTPVIRKYFYFLYGVGFDTGRFESGKNSEIPVTLFKNDIKIADFPSGVAVSKYLRVSPITISKWLRNKTKGRKGYSVEKINKKT